MDVVRLYPQYNILYERRQQQAPVSPIAFERRSGVDRRSEDRVKLDTNLTRDIFEIKSKVAQIQKVNNPSSQSNTNNLSFTQNTSPQKTEKVAFSQNISNTDQFIKSRKPTVTESPKEIAKSKSHSGALGGMLAVILGGTLASTFLGVTGIGIAIAVGAYFGGRVLKNAIVSHIKNK